MCVQGIQRVKCTVQLSLHTCYYTTIFLCISLEDLYASPPHNRQDFTPQKNSTRWFDTNDSRSHDIAHRSASGSVTKAGWWIASKGVRVGGPFIHRIFGPKGPNDREVQPSFDMGVMI